MAIERLSQPKDHGQARHLHASFEFADERLVRAAEIGESVLREISSKSEFAQTLTEDDTLRLRLNRHGKISLAIAVAAWYAMTYH